MFIIIIFIQKSVQDFVHVDWKNYKSKKSQIRDQIIVGHIEIHVICELSLFSPAKYRGEIFTSSNILEVQPSKGNIAIIISS